LEKYPFGVPLGFKVISEIPHPSDQIVQSCQFQLGRLEVARKPDWALLQVPNIQDYWHRYPPFEIAAIRGPSFSLNASRTGRGTKQLTSPPNRVISLITLELRKV
jgi:hypothetical protein